MIKRLGVAFAMAFVAMIAGTTWYLAVRANKTQKAVAWIQAQELGLVRFDWQDPGLGYTPIQDGIRKASWIRRSWGGIDEIAIRDPLLTDLTPISNADAIRYVDISTEQELDLAPIAELRKLEYLTLSAKRVQSLAPLKNLPELKLLRIIDTEIPQDAVTELRLTRPDIQFSLLTSSGNLNANTEP